MQVFKRRLIKMGQGKAGTFRKKKKEESEGEKNVRRLMFLVRNSRTALKGQKAGVRPSHHK